MVDDRDDDDILELTAEMASVPPPPAASDTAEGSDEGADTASETGNADAITPPPRPSNPFIQVAEPRPSRPPSVIPDPDPEEMQQQRPSYIPKESAVPVVAIPIRKLHKDGKPRKRKKLGKKSKPPAPAPKAASKDKKDQSSKTTATVETKTKPKEKETKDSGTPEAVFDAVSEPTPTAPAIDAKPSHKSTNGDDEEELDLTDAEEVKVKPKKTKAVGDPKPPKKKRRTKMRRKRRRPKEWWEDIFDDDYLSLLPRSTPRDLRREVDVIENALNIPKGGLVLDLACGDGRHAVGLARRGYRIVGVDLSLPMLARAGDAAQEAGQTINFIHGDMRDLGFDRTFDAIYCVGTSFGYFDEQTNYKVLSGIAKSLKPGAPFLLEVVNRDHAIQGQPNLTWFEGNGSVCMEETNFNFLNSRLTVVRQLILGENARQIRHELSVRLYSLHEVGSMLYSTGLSVSQISGHPATPGAFFGEDSAQIIIVANRRG
ncbi:MAG: methyltransferase domain-containing protein [Myxococcota bacterium]|nr:methyltransferase domain-containing protein [Myxococcota bacterium]